MRKLGLIVSVTCILYLFAWPVPVEPVAWNAPPNEGYVGRFAANDALAGIEQFELDGLHGPEDIAIGPDGKIYAATGEGYIIRLTADGKQLERWVNTAGRPLGIEFDKNGNLLVADAYKGLLSISSNGAIKVLSDTFKGQPIKYADDLAVADNGVIYFSDASTKFGAEESGGTYQGSLLDVMEHGAHGRLLSYDPGTGKTALIVDGIDFANGVAMSFDQKSVLLNETGTYRVLRIALEGPHKGQVDVVLDNLPGFPDNLSQGLNGRYWIGLISPRSAALDGLSNSPFLRKVVQRLPAFMRPKAQLYGHIVAFNDAGEVLENLQDPNTTYSHMTGVEETPEFLYISSLHAKTLARLPRK